MYALTWASLSTGKHIIGSTRYDSKVDAARAAEFAEWYYAQRGFDIPHAVCWVDDPDPRRTTEAVNEPGQGSSLLSGSAASAAAGRGS